MLNTLIGPGPSKPPSARSTRLSQPAFGPIRKIQAIASTGIGTSSGNRMIAKAISRPGRSVRSISQASANATVKVSATVPATKTNVSGRMRV